MRKIVALGLAGALVIGSASASAVFAAAATKPSAHAAWCEQNYRSYNPSTDSFIGYDGVAHRCVSPDATGARAFGLANPVPFITTNPTPQNLPGNRYNVFPSESDPNYGLSQN